MYRKGSSKIERTPELSAAEAAGKAALLRWFKSGVGRQQETSRRTGITPANLSKMAKNEGKNPIGLEHAILIEVATGGELRAQTLCPSRADVLGELLALRTGGEVKAS